MERPIPTAVGLEGSLVAVAFADFDLSLNPGMAAAMRQCEKVAAGESWCALLVGSIGCGKTMLAAAALNASVHPKPGRFIEIAKLLSGLRRDMFKSNGPSEDELVSFYESDPGLLVIDDLGTETQPRHGEEQTWPQKILFTIINTREKAKRPTILTSNSAATLDERIVSRCYAGVVSCIGQDVRRLPRGGN